MIVRETKGKGTWNVNIRNEIVNNKLLFSFFSSIICLSFPFSPQPPETTSPWRRYTVVAGEPVAEKGRKKGMKNKEKEKEKEKEQVSNQLQLQKESLRCCWETCYFPPLFALLSFSPLFPSSSPLAASSCPFGLPRGGEGGNRWKKGRRKKRGWCFLSLNSIRPKGVGPLKGCGTRKKEI